MWNLTFAFLAVAFCSFSGALAAGSAEDARSDKLKTAAYAGDFDTVKKWVMAGTNINSGKSEGFSVLGNAVMMGHDEIAVWLISKGAAIDTTGGTHLGTTLMNAAASHCIETLRLLLERGVHTNTKDELGWTALMLAAHKNDVQAVRLLVEHRGTRLNLRNDSGGTVLHVAARANAVPVVRYLLDQGADPTVRDDSGQTAFQVARGQSACAWEGESSVASAREVMALLARDSASSPNGAIHHYPR